MKRLNTPVGMRDYLQVDCRRRRALREKLKNYAECCGFDCIETPTLEFLDAFKGQLRTGSDEQMMKLIDRDGNIAVMRPDMTVPAARVMATGLRQEQKPVKLYYEGHVYRELEKGGSNQREFYQFGIEMYGDGSLWSDIECIKMACDCLNVSGLKDFKLDIGHAGIFEGIMQGLNLDETVYARIKELVDSKNLAELEGTLDEMQIDQETKAMLLMLPQLFGAPKDVLEKASLLYLRQNVGKAVKYLAALYEQLEVMGLASYIEFELGMTAKQDYYTGILMKGYTHGVGSAILSGGRYDGLLAEFNGSHPATGFAVDIDKLKEAVFPDGKVPEEQKRVLIVFDEKQAKKAFDEAEKLRNSNVTVGLVFDASVKDMRAYMENHRYTRLIRMTAQ